MSASVIKSRIKTKEKDKSNSAIFTPITCTMHFYTDVTAVFVFVSSQHGIPRRLRREKDLDKNFICNQYGERLAILIVDE